MKEIDLTKLQWTNYKNNKIKIKRINGEILIENNSNKVGMVVCLKLFKKPENGLKLEFKGKAIEGEAAVLEFINKNRNVIAETTLNSTMYISNEQFKYFLIVLKIFPKTKILINKMKYIQTEILEDDIFNNLNNDTLIITPSYPSEEHKYLSGFVHSRVKEYKKNKINTDIAVVYDYLNVCKYEFEGINVTRMSYINLRSLIQKKKYKKILIHFFDEKYFNVLEGCDLTDTEILVWVHGPETLYWDYPYFTTEYFKENNIIDEEQRKQFEKNDNIIKKLNEMENVKFVFVSKWIKDKSEELINIKFKNYEVIPNIIDTKLFDYKQKDESKMKKIFILRRFDNINKYAVDVSVRTIMELSKRPNFDEYEFNIYGNGEVHDKLFEPIKTFKNVKFYKSFYTHEEIAKIHKENGIALFPTRYDAQGVSMCEAGSSGLLVVSSDNDAIKEFIPYEDGNIIETEDYKKYADFIEKVSNDKNLFNKITKETRKKIEDKCSYESTVKKEIELIKEKNKVNTIPLDLSNHDCKPILSIIIPCYNVSQFIVKTLRTLINNNKNSKYLEILPVNDGSKDNTKDIINKFIKDNYKGNKENCIIKLIDKENGGHGSTINAGILQATGKYLRIIDGDDWVKTSELEKLIDILKKETNDIVITNYSEDLYYDRTCTLNEKRNYNFMIPGYKYNFEDLCYDNYGFTEWGPILATANIKTDKLKEANFKLSEHTFYVDMEYNAYYLPVIETITYYDLDIYRYFIGNINQSTSLKSFVKNVEHHERVIKNILEFINSTNMSTNKKNYIYNRLTKPMILVHYRLIINNIRSKKEFNKFDSIIRQYLPINEQKSFGKSVNILRKTKGNFIKILSILFLIWGKDR